MGYYLSRIACLICSLILVSCGGGGGGGGGEQAPIPAKPIPASVTGSVLAVANSAIDSDVNDVSSPFSPNDNFASAQVIANLTTLGGYLNQPGQGQQGRSLLSGDTDDYYEIDLEAGQSVSLVMADSSVSNNINLTLFDSNQMIVDQSSSNGLIECVENSAAGRHFIRANILQGASNYTLSVTSLACAATVASSSLRLAADFVPSEMIVRFSDDDAISQMHTDLVEMGMDMVPMPHQRYTRVYVSDMAKASQALTALKLNEKHMPEVLYSKAMTLALINALREFDGVELVEPNYIYHAFATPNDPFFVRQWHYPLINLPDAWDQAVGGSGATVAVLDTGVLTTHPDLQSNLISGYDFISNLGIAKDGDGIDSDPSDPGDSLVPGLSTFHGSHVAGTVAAVANNSAGVAGAAFYSNIKVMPLRVLGVGGGTFTDICEALRYTARLSNASNTLPSSAADIVNMSLGSPSFSQFLQDCINDVRAEGVIIIAAAGNSASSTPTYPAAHNGVISVSAVDLSKNLANYSSFGTSIDVAAPGGEASDDNGDGIIDGVYSTLGDDSSGSIVNTYGYLIGTSMATPHVSAVAALMKSVAPGLTPDMFDAFLTAGELSDDLGPIGRDDSFGFGLVNANKAVLRAQGMVPMAPVISAAPSGVNFGLVETTTQVSVSNVGGGSLFVNAPTENSGGWLAINAPTGNGEGVYTLTADRSHPALANPGSYSATLALTSNGGNLNLPVLLQVLQTGQSESANAGHQFILLVDAETIELAGQVDADAVSGRYEFGFENVPPGNYLLFSTSDNDNDFSVCDAGEACGALGTLDEPFVIQVGAGDVIDVGDFFVGFNFAASASALAVLPGEGALRR